MNTVTRVAGFGIGLAMAGIDSDGPPARGEGVVSSVDGYRLVPAATALEAGGGNFNFVIRGRDEAPVTRFALSHERQLHLIVVSRELTSYHHVHPTLAADGTWSVPLPSLPPGSYRAVADFRVAGGPALALGVDLGVAGSCQPSAIPAPAPDFSVDGYDVSIGAAPAAAGETTFALTVRRGGAPVTDLRPYLGASGHLVAIRLGDLAYAHVHPLAYAGGAVTFAATLPTAGRYRLFFDFQHGDVVRTASFTYDQGPVAPASSSEH
ncbi:MAG: hypothetical protein ABI912_05185 [Actinomycetota bacterium]